MTESAHVPLCGERQDEEGRCVVCGRGFADWLGVEFVDLEAADD